MNKYFEYFNPKQLIVDDCIIRALCKVLNKDWYEVYDLLTELGRESCRPFVFTSFLPVIIERFNLKAYKISTPKKGCKSVTVESFCKANPRGTYLLQCANHLTSVLDGKFYDLAVEFADSKVYKYWQKL